MHPDQLVLSQELAAQLISRLLPGTDPATIRLLPTSATTSTVVRIGDDLAARFPLEPSDPDAARTALAAEHEAVAEFAAVCPLPAPEPVALGEASAEFPMPWSVQTWIPGEVADPVVLEGSDAAADDLTALLLALRAAPTRADASPAPAAAASSPPTRTGCASASSAPATCCPWTPSPHAGSDGAASNGTTRT